MTTVSEATGRKEVPREVPPPAAPEPLRAEPRTCANSVALPSPPAPTPVTERVRAAGDTLAKAAAMLDKPGTLLHSQPPTFRQAHDRHRECADWFKAPAAKALRRAWGWLHLLVILPPLYLAAWVTESPARLLVAAALIAAIWFFS